MSMSKTKSLTLLSMIVFTVVLSGCRYDMQDQPRLKSFKESDFFANKMGSRTPVAGTVARGFLREDKALYTGKKDVLSTEAPMTMTDAEGNVLVTTFPNDIDYFPIPVTKETLDRGEDRYKIYCSVCHGPLGNSDGIIVRRGFSKPPSYHDERLRNAPVGHFFDVASNGSGKMNGYASQIPVADRWAIVAYIRALQISQNPNGVKPLGPAPAGTNANTPAASTNQRQTTQNANTSANSANSNAARPAASNSNAGGTR